MTYVLLFCLGALVGRYIRPRRLGSLLSGPVFTECGDVVYADYRGDTWICSRDKATHDLGIYGIPWRLVRGTLPLYTCGVHSVLRHAWQAHVLQQRMIDDTMRLTAGDA